VLQFLKNRSSWFALHEFVETLSLKNLSFKVVHCSPEFQPIVDRFERNELSGDVFLKAAETLRLQLHTAIREGLKS
jgi:hypothetical protein